MPGEPSDTQPRLGGRYENVGGRHQVSEGAGRARMSEPETSLSVPSGTRDGKTDRSFLVMRCRRGRCSRLSYLALYWFARVGLFP